MACGRKFEQHEHSWILPKIPDSGAGTEEWYATNGDATHMQIWPAARSFASWLERHQHDLGLNTSGVRIMELGAGTGWLGKVLALNLESVDIVLTDRFESIPKLEQLMSEADMLLPRSSTSSVRMEPLDWHEFEPDAGRSDSTSLALLPTPLDGIAFDLVLGSDLVYNNSSAHILPWVIRAALEQGVGETATLPTALYAHWCRSPRILSLFLKCCEEAQLLYEDCTHQQSAHDELQSATVMFEKSAQNVFSGAKTPDDGCEEDDTDWMSVIFADTKMLVDEPIFKVYSFRLSCCQSSPECH